MRLGATRRVASCVAGGGEGRGSWMDRSRIAEIVDKWMIPTAKTAYMAGLEKKPVIAAARGV